MSSHDQYRNAAAPLAHECERQTVYAATREITMHAPEYIRAQMLATIVGVSLTEREIEAVEQRICDAAERIANHIGQANLKAHRADEARQTLASRAEALSDALTQRDEKIRDLEAQLCAERTCIKPHQALNSPPPAQEPQDDQDDDQDEVEEADDPHVKHLAARMDAMCRQLGALLTQQQTALARIESIEGRLNAKK